MEDKIVYFKLKMKKSERIKIKTEATLRDVTMQDFILNCALKCCDN